MEAAQGEAARPQAHCSQAVELALESAFLSLEPPNHCPPLPLFISGIWEGLRGEASGARGVGGRQSPRLQSLLGLVWSP